MQSVSSTIWTRVAVFISYDDNNYTTGTSKKTFFWDSYKLSYFATKPTNQANNYPKIYYYIVVNFPHL